MIKVLEDMPENVLGVEAAGKVTNDDYENVLIPAIQDARNADTKIRFIYVLGEDFDGWSLGAMWQDAMLRLRDLRAWEKVAIVSDLDWVKHTVHAFGWMMPGEVRVYTRDELTEAKEWAAV